MNFRKPIKRNVDIEDNVRSSSSGNNSSDVKPAHREISECSQEIRFVKLLLLISRGCQRIALVTSTKQCLQHVYVNPTHAFVCAA